MPNRKLPLQFENVVADKFAIGEISPGPRVKAVVLEFGATNAAANAEKAFSDIIDDIQVVVDDEVQRLMTALQLDDINKDNGSLYGVRTYDPSSANNCLYHLPIYFFKPWLKILAHQELSSWTTNWMRSFQIKVKLKAADIANIVLGGYYVYDDLVLKGGATPSIEKWVRFDKAVGGVRQTFPGFFDQKDKVSQVTIYNPSGGQTITRAQLKLGGAGEVYDLTKRRSSSFNQQIAEMNIGSESSADTGRFHMVFDESGNPDDGEDMTNRANELTLEYSAAASGTITGISQRTGSPE